MNRSSNSGENLICSKCGKHYADFYDGCPYCEADRLSKLVSKKKPLPNRGQLIASILLAVLLAGGAGLLGFHLYSYGDMTIAPEQASENADELIDHLSYGVMRQELVLPADVMPDPVTDPTLLLPGSSEEDTEDSDSTDTSEGGEIDTLD